MKSHAAIIGLFTLMLSAAPTLGADAPKIFAQGQKYVTDLKGCRESDNETDVMQLTAKGMSAYEFGCTFVQVLPVPGDEVFGTYQYLATAVCGDDTGVSRADSIVLSDNENGTLRVTSQNDYLTQLAWERGGEAGDVNWLVEREFTLCPTN